MTDRTDIDERLIPPLLDLLGLGVKMRLAQVTYFKTRTRENLIASKQAEQAFDVAVARLAPYLPKPAQQGLFDGADK